MKLLGQVSCNQRGQNASQPNLGGTSLGSFNDRFRDALVGGSPFGPPRYQGFGTGLVTQPSSYMEVCRPGPAADCLLGCVGRTGAGAMGPCNHAQVAGPQSVWCLLSEDEDEDEDVERDFLPGYTAEQALTDPAWKL